MSGPLYTTYMTYDLIDEDNPDAMMIMMAIHGIKDIRAVCKTLIEYTNNPQEDMFLVDI